MPTRKWGNEKLVNTTTAGNQFNSDTAALAGGGFVVVWEDESAGADAAIRGQRYNAAGNPVGGEMLIAPTIAGIDLDSPSVTGLADGGFYVTWTQNFGAYNYIQGKVYNANGVFVRDQPVIFAFGRDDDVDVARLGTGSLATWTDPDAAGGGGVLFRIFDAAGKGDIVLTANSATAGFRDHPAAAASPDGLTAAIVWGTAIDVKARVFGQTGDTFGAEFQINGSRRLSAEDPVVAWLNNQTFVVAWRDEEPGATTWNDIRARIFVLGGVAVALTGDILVNSTVSKNQMSPMIAALPDGGFVVGWEDFSAYGAGAGITVRLQAFDAIGGKIGGEMVVNTTTTTTSNVYPSIAALADGRVAVSWTDSSSGNKDIRVQIVDPRDGIVAGTPNADTLYGHAIVNDEISGFGGSDTIYGLGGNDALYGGDAGDVLDGGAGEDLLFGGAGADTLTGGAGDDELYGEDGADNLRGGAGADLLDGGASTDTANYAAALASVTAALDGSLAGTGDAAGDVFISIENLYGANIAGAGDFLRGDGGVNTMNGFAGNDTLQGLDGADRLTGGPGADTLTGGAGNDDFFYYAQAEGGDQITDFSAVAGNDDRFRFQGSAFGGLPAGALAAAQFQSSTASVAANTSVRFFYETDTGILRFDQDGSGAAFAPVVIATLQAGATVVIGDILIF